MFEPSRTSCLSDGEVNSGVSVLVFLSEESGVDLIDTEIVASSLGDVKLESGWLGSTGLILLGTVDIVVIVITDLEIVEVFHEALEWHEEDTVILSLMR